MRFEQIRIGGYRSLQSVEVPLRPLNVLIGPNGSGKTSFLDAFEFLSQGARRELARAISRRGGWQQLVTQLPDGLHNPQINFRLRATNDSNPVQDDRSTPSELEYRLTLLPGRVGGYVIETEELWSDLDNPLLEPTQWVRQSGHGMPAEFFDGTRYVEPAAGYDTNELGIAQVPNIYKTTERFRAQLAACGLYTPPETGPHSALRNPQPLDPLATSPGPQGENLLAVLYNLKEGADERFSRIIEALRAGFEDLADLKLPVVSAGRVTLTWHDRKGRKFYPDQLSEGTLRFLWLVTLLLSVSPGTPPALFLDEPELSLHPEMFKILAGLLREASDSSQVFVATHSDQLVRWLQPGDLMLFDKEDGVTKVRRGDDPDLDVKRWLDEYTLDQVWLMGEMGARP